MKRISIIFLLFLTVFTSQLSAKEGMWIPLFLGELNEAQMKEMGMNITAEDIYSINNASLKDAIVIFGRGCTGELISDQGLLLTNHHCGYGQIQSHSSIEHDYLTDGFWAMDKGEELVNPGLTATFLVEMREVTEEVLKGIDEQLDEKKRDELVKDNIKKLKEANAMDNGIDIVIKPFFSGNRYFMFFYEVYKDIRLVGAPPSNIGKFGGDTDNWMWPRHTGDFSLFRIYADENNRPAKYAKDNVPYNPKKHLKISLQGVEKGDFTFVYGYPGTTREYLVSDAVKLITEEENPIKIKMRTIRLDIMKAAQNLDPKVRIQYAGKVASLANGWKKWQGENKGIKRMNAIENKFIKENEMIKWMDENPEMKAKYSDVIPEYRKLYAELSPWTKQYQYYREAGMGIELVSFASRFQNIIEELEKEELDETKIEEMAVKLDKSIASFFKNYYQPIDEAIAVRLLDEYYVGVDTEDLPDYFTFIEKKYKNDFKKYVSYLFEKSIFTQQDDLTSLLAKHDKKFLKTIKKDPAFQFSQSLTNKSEEIKEASEDLTSGLQGLDRAYMQMQMDYQPTEVFYPDANFTMRIAYGQVDGYFPRDGVYYEHFTTLDGIMQKENPDIYDYVVEDQLKKLYQEKDFGAYANKEGQMNVCFAASNHTTGGNSGSPVFNADGHLIGINFDRNWEGTMSDIVYDPDQCRNITLDIRYCLFIIDKFAGAGHLVEEMSLIK
ncbi:S46 family peptidase [Lentimicrobium sp. S6]|uniref:S46 family peptidase n=1 Tax=Lentimicrobium sp. S6 TaxID=2735872 RepID=UPI001555883E|nr:S46 family peptidase [Lentimicrobium sp. S6]NPD44439.1 S46 family peptidase [Lentimicrobium sp. S6]